MLLDPTMDIIYLDHASTSFPKPPGVAEAMSRHLRERAVNPGRAGYDLARTAAADIDALRRRCDRFFNNPAADPDQCVFTANATDALNLAISGICRPGDHVVTTAVEHNSVLRPLHALQQAGLIEWTAVPCDGRGRVDPADRRPLRRPGPVDARRKRQEPGPRAAARPAGAGRPGRARG